MWGKTKSRQEEDGRRPTVDEPRQRGHVGVVNKTGEEEPVSITEGI